MNHLEKLLNAIEVTFKSQPRNEYEAESLAMKQREKLAAVRNSLADFSGEYADKLLARVVELEKRQVQAPGCAVPSANDAFSLDFNDDDGDVDGEIAEVHAQMQKESSKRLKKPKKPKVKAKPATPKTDDEHETGALPPKADDGPLEVIAPSVQLREVARYDGCSSNDIPCEVIGEGECFRIPNSARSALFFVQEVDFDGVPCCVRVELYRCVLVALEEGRPSGILPDVAAAGAFAFAMAESLPAASAFQDEESEDWDADAEAEEVPAGGGGDDGLVALSEQLVAEYDIMQDEKDFNYLLPSKISPRLCSALRGFTTTTWVILMCYGGYFAGGVFTQDRCVVHKAFQRYVVRKKQGGKQSSNSKDVGSYNSAGSMIRAGQELKWKVDVRDILLAWRAYIDVASVVLYAAPGPQNRSILTDFAALPASVWNGSRREVSPVSAKDPRVHKVPLTTKRPTFAEVERIYKEVSRCSVSYVTKSPL